ncbi:MAG: ABC transporter ATP-binding protein [Dehalococcoidia bacterium]
MTAAPAIEVRGLSKRYGASTVLNAVDLELAPGSKTALVGANGAGKSTLLAILSTLVVPNDGRARIAGFDVQREGVEVRRRIGVLSHRPMLYEDLTPLENLLFFSALYRVPGAHARAEAFLRLLGLWSRRAEPVSVLSRGYHQRLGIARALIHSPEVLLLDEPETGLDGEGMELLDGLMLHERSFTVLAATHRVDRVEGWADAVVRVSHGRLDIDGGRPRTATMAG